MGPAPRFVILEGCSPQVVARAHAAAMATGVPLVEGWAGAGKGVTCCARVDDAASAERAVLAAIAGAGLLVEASAGREVLDRLCDDLRHLGPLEHRVAECASPPVMTAEEEALLALLAAGASLGDAARTLHLSRRTADRRLAAARQALGTASTSEALVVARRLGLGSSGGPATRP